MVRPSYDCGVWLDCATVWLENVLGCSNIQVMYVCKVCRNALYINALCLAIMLKKRLGNTFWSLYLGNQKYVCLPLAPAPVLLNQDADTVETYVSLMSAPCHSFACKPQATLGLQPTRRHDHTQDISILAQVAWLCHLWWQFWWNHALVSKTFYSIVWYRYVCP